jgi:hypothetical protein
MDVSFLLAAAEGAKEKSHTPFFIAGGLLATFAVLISVFGFTRPDFPPDGTTARAVMALGALLVASTMFAAVYVSS